MGMCSQIGDSVKLNCNILRNSRGAGAGLSMRFVGSPLVPSSYQCCHAGKGLVFPAWVQAIDAVCFRCLHQCHQKSKPALNAGFQRHGGGAHSVELSYQ